MIKCAVVIGINYTNFPLTVQSELIQRASLHSLRYAEDDARDMAKILEESDYKVTSLRGAEATRIAIIKALRQQRDAAGPDGLLLVHFSGHGAVYSDEIAYLLPVDADPEALDGTAIPLNTLVHDYLGDVGSSLTLLDCCHSGYAVGFRGSADRDERGRAFLRQAERPFNSVYNSVYNRIVLAACAGDEKAKEFSELKHGAFTYYVLEHWRTSAVLRDSTLFDAVDEALQQRHLPRPVRGGVQQGGIDLRTGTPDTRQISLILPPPHIGDPIPSPSGPITSTSPVVNGPVVVRASRSTNRWLRGGVLAVLLMLFVLGGFWILIPPSLPGRIAFVSAPNADTNFQIYVKPAVGGALTWLRTISTHDAVPAWSPDGQWIAFASFRNSIYQLYKMRADSTGEPTQLATNPEGYWHPTWSPDGTQLAFATYNGLENPNSIIDESQAVAGIYVMSAEGGPPRRLINTPAYDGDPSWSPDGQQIAFTSGQNGKFAVYTINLDGSALQLLNTGNDLANNRAPAWSPDGKRIVFQSDRDGNWEIYIMKATGGSPQRLTDNPSYDISPVWSPDGQYIAFQSYRDNHNQIYVMRAADGSQPRRMIDPPNYYDADPTWGRNP